MWLIIHVWDLSADLHATLWGMPFHLGVMLRHTPSALWDALTT